PTLFRSEHQHDVEVRDLNVGAALDGHLGRPGSEDVHDYHRHRGPGGTAYFTFLVSRGSEGGGGCPVILLLKVDVEHAIGTRLGLGGVGGGVHRDRKSVV